MRYTLKEQLVHYMELRGLGISQLARKTGVPKQTIHDWLVGKKPREPLQVLQVARALGTSMEHLLFGSLENPEDRKVTEIDALMGDGWLTGLFEVKLRRIRQPKDE